MIPKYYVPYIIAFSATLVRYYDYALFGLSASVISSTFMPKVAEVDQFLCFFAVFSISVLARPIGSIIFGRIGDRVGRVAVVKNAAALGAISTILIAFIPGYDLIGFWAILLLMVCRILFLMSLAGEIDAVKVYVAEKVAKKRRHLTNGITSFCAQIGVFLAAFMYHFTSDIQDYFWLWRLNFLLGGVFGFIVIFFRKYLQESEVFLTSKSKETLEIGSDLLSIIKRNKTKFMISLVLSGMLGGMYNFLITFLSTFAGNVVGIIPASFASLNNIILVGIYALSCLASGFTADKVNINKQIISALVLSTFILLIMPFMVLNDYLILELHRLLVLLVPFFAIPIQIKIQSLFTTITRMRMYSFSHSLGSMVFSSTTPFFCTLLWKYTQLFSIVLSFFMIQLAVVFFLMIFMSKKNFDNMFET